MNNVDKQDPTKQDATKYEAGRPQGSTAPGNTAQASTVQADLNKVGEDASMLAQHAVEAIRRAADAFASQAGVTASDAVSAARSAGAATVDSIGAVASDTKAATEEGFEALGRTVKRNPLTALAIAAGTGVLLGWMTSSDSRR